MLKENLENVEQKIQAACERSGRDRSEVTLIAVSKTKPAEMSRKLMILESVFSVKIKFRKSWISRKYFLLIFTGI